MCFKITGQNALPKFQHFKLNGMPLIETIDKLKRPVYHWKPVTIFFTVIDLVNTSKMAKTFNRKS